MLPIGPAGPGAGIAASGDSIWMVSDGHTVETRAEPTCGGAAELFNHGPQAGSDGEEAADGGKCDGGPAVGPGRNRYTVQRSLRWRSRTAVRWGPRFCSTAPGRIPRPSPHSFPRWATPSGATAALEEAAQIRDF
jgi:hypothetical protein